MYLSFKKVKTTCNIRCFSKLHACWIYWTT